MSTPITDAAAYPPAIFQDHVELVPADLARLLELDRAALMDALERIADICEIKRDKWIAKFIKEALSSTTRANFPTP